MIAYLTVVLLSATASMLLVNVARVLLVSHGIVDTPNHRSSHDRIVPRGGGVAIVVVVVVIVSASWATVADPSRSLMLLGAVAVLFALLGLADDARDLPVKARLLVQGLLSLVAASAVLGGTVMGTWHSAAVLLLGALGIVGATNIFNFMDGIDGIAGLTAVVSAGSSAVVAVLLGATGEALLALAVLGASAGFLTQNWSPARIFMGDSGSLFLGFLAVAVPLRLAVVDLRSLFLVGALIPFLIDGTFTILRRRRRGERVTEAHRDHVYQRAARRWGHAPVAAAYGFGALLFPLLGLAVGWQAWRVGIGALLVMTLAACGMWTGLSRGLDTRSAA